MAPFIVAMERLSLLNSFAGFRSSSGRSGNYANKKGYSRHKPALPLYTREDAEHALSFFNPVNFHEIIKVGDELTASFSRAGHILEASCILIGAANRRIGFSGDVGRFNEFLIMFPPEPMPDADYLVLESTYGDSDHIMKMFYIEWHPLLTRWLKMAVPFSAGICGWPRSTYFITGIKTQKRKNSYLILRPILIVPWPLTPLTYTANITLNIGLAKKNAGSNVCFGHYYKDTCGISRNQ